MTSQCILQSSSNLCFGEALEKPFRIRTAECGIQTIEFLFVTRIPSPFTSESMENSLAQQGKFGSSEHHALDQFQLVDFSFDQTVIGRQRQASSDGHFVSFNTQDKALQFADLAGSDLLKPNVELFSWTCA